MMRRNLTMALMGLIAGSLLTSFYTSMSVLSKCTGASCPSSRVTSPSPSPLPRATLRPTARQPDTAVPSKGPPPTSPPEAGTERARREKHMKLSKLLDMTKAIAPEEFLPYEDVVGKPPKTSVRCMKRGMQQKCVFNWFEVVNNTFYVSGLPPNAYPNPIYPADGLVKPLWEHHRYKGHKIRSVPSLTCTRVVRRPTVFLYRMSGHSTYHLWENNLGPFFDTLQRWTEYKKDLNDVSKLLIAFVDLKPTSGPKAPHLLDTLLQTFTDLPLINASRITQRTCFETAVVGISSSNFDHAKLLRAMQLHIVGKLPGPLPEQPRVLFISRNHKTVVRGRKIANEDEVVEAANRTVLELTGKAMGYIHMQDYSYVEQVQKAMEVQVILGPHGGGIANCIWMREGSVAMEFAAPVGKTLFGLYHSMCKRSKVTHLSFVAEPDPGDKQLPASALNNNPRLFSNMLIPPDMMEKEVTRAITTYRQNLKKFGDRSAGG